MQQSSSFYSAAKSEKSQEEVCQWYQSIYIIGCRGGNTAAVQSILQLEIAIKPIPGTKAVRPEGQPAGLHHRFCFFDAEELDADFFSRNVVLLRRRPHEAAWPHLVFHSLLCDDGNILGRKACRQAFRTDLTLFVFVNSANIVSFLFRSLPNSRPSSEGSAPLRLPVEYPSTPNARSAGNAGRTPWLLAVSLMISLTVRSRADRIERAVSQARRFAAGARQGKLYPFRVASCHARKYGIY